MNKHPVNNDVVSTKLEPQTIATSTRPSIVSLQKASIDYDNI